MDWAASWSDGVDRFDRYSKTLYWACVQLVTKSEWRVGSTAQKTPIFNVTSTLVFLTVRLSVGDIFSQEYATHIRILYKKNYRNWTSGYWDIYIVLFLWSDHYSVRGMRPPLQGMIPWRDWLPGVSYHGESSSLGYYTPGSHVLANFLWTPPGYQVSYPSESCFYTALFIKMSLFYSLYLLNLMR